MLAKAIGAWLAVVVLLLGASPAYGDTSAEIATRLAHAKTALTAIRGQLTPEQWGLLSDKLTGAEKALADYDQLVAQTGRTLATAEASAAASTKALAAEGEATAARGTVSVLGRVGVIFLSLVTLQGDDDPGSTNPVKKGCWKRNSRKSVEWQNRSKWKSSRPARFPPPSPPGARSKTETSTTSRLIRMTCPMPVEGRGRQGFDRSSEKREWH